MLRPPLQVRSGPTGDILKIFLLVLLVPAIPSATPANLLVVIFSSWVRYWAITIENRGGRDEDGGEPRGHGRPKGRTVAGC